MYIMTKNALLLAVLFILTVSALPALGQGSAELLERGIYLEETAGELDQAIEIYHRIENDATASHVHVAEALLRRGLCHLEMGDTKAAAAAFERVLTDFSAEEPFVTQARENMLGKPANIDWLPAPWDDGEVLRMTLKLPSGKPIGAFFITVDTIGSEGEELWRFRAQQKIFSEADSQALREVVVRRDTMAPVRSLLKHTAVGHFEAEYKTTEEGKGVVIIDTAGVDAKREQSFEGRIFDNEEGWHMFRRLPLEVGYKKTMKLLSPVAGGPTPVEIRITKKEKVTVPAGEFECYRMEFSVPQVFWFSTDPSRVLVKWEGSGVVAELDEIYSRESGRPSVYRDEDLGLAVTLPPDWLIYPQVKEDSDVLLLLDPRAEAQAQMEIWRSLGEPPSPRGKSCFLQAVIPAKLYEAGTALPAFRLRDGTWHEHERGGWSAVSFMGDYRAGDHGNVHYYTFIENEPFCVDFTLQVPDKRLETMRPVFDSILDSYEAPPPPINPVAKSEEFLAVRFVLADFHAAAAAGDQERYFEHLSADAVFLGPDVTDRFDVAQWRGCFGDTLGWMAEPSEQNVFVADDGSLAWFDERLAHPRLGELRGSGVLRREEDRFKIVQYHVAFTVPDPLLGELGAKLRAHDEKAGPRIMPSFDGEAAEESATAVRAWLREFQSVEPELDYEHVFRRFAPEAVILLTDRSERVSLPGFRALMRLHLGGGPRPTLTPIEQWARLAPNPDLAWFDELVEAEGLGPMRATGVARKIDGTWKFVHLNIVIPIPHEMTADLARRIDTFYAPG